MPHSFSETPYDLNSEDYYAGKTVGSGGELADNDTRSTTNFIEIPGTISIVRLINETVDMNLSCYDKNHTYLGWTPHTPLVNWFSPGTHDVILLPDTKYVRANSRAKISFNDNHFGIYFCNGFSQAVDKETVEYIIDSKSTESTIKNTDNLIYQINNGFDDTSCADAQITMDNKYGIIGFSYIGAYGGYGERHDYMTLSLFPIHQPFRAKHVKILNSSLGSNNILSLGNGVFRNFYTVSRGNTTITCYKDYNFVNETLGEEQTVQMRNYSGNLVTASLAEMNQYIIDSGLTVPSGADSEFYTITKYKRDSNGAYYGAFTGYGNYSLIFKTTDTFETLDIIGVFDKVVAYEDDILIKDGNIYVVYRTNSTIYFTYAAIDSSYNISTWSSPQAIPTSISSRPRIFEYKNKIAILYSTNPSISTTFPSNGRRGVEIIWGTGTNISTYSKIFVYEGKYGLVYPDIFVNYDDIYLGFSDARAGLCEKNVSPNSEQGKECMEFMRITDLLTV